jgi:single-stranded DNA-binding protein
MMLGQLGHVALRPLGNRKTVLVQAEIEVDEDVFGVEVNGKLAEEVAAMPRGTLVQVFGKLKQYLWKTSRGKQDRERVVVLAEHVNPIMRPEKKAE